MRTIYTKSLIDKDTEASLWDSAIFVFESSAIFEVVSETDFSISEKLEILLFLNSVINCCSLKVISLKASSS